MLDQDRVTARVCYLLAKSGMTLPDVEPADMLWWVEKAFADLLTLEPFEPRRL